MGNFIESTQHRLREYGVFSDRSVSAVASSFAAQKEYDTYQAFFSAVGVPLEPVIFMNEEGRAVPLVDISPRSEGQQGVFVIHLPMGNPLDTNQLYQVATLAHLFPAYRVIAFGNPSGAPYAIKQQNFSPSDWWRVAFTSKKRAVVRTELDYLESQGIEGAIHIGYSYGALKALLLAQYAPANAVAHLILLEPVAHPRGPHQLLGDFVATFSTLGDYVNRTGLQTFLDARQDAVRSVEYNKGIARPVNAAIGIMLARTDFISLLGGLLAKNDRLKVFVAWGSKSELGNDAHMQASLHSFAHKEYKRRVRSLRLEGDTHAFANDLAEYGAVVHEALL